MIAKIGENIILNEIRVFDNKDLNVSYYQPGVHLPDKWIVYPWDLC